MLPNTSRKQATETDHYTTNMTNNKTTNQTQPRQMKVPPGP